MNRKRLVLVAILLILAVTLAGCRIRTVSDPNLADTVLTSVQPSPPPAESEEPEPSDTPEPEPTPTPEPTPPPEELPPSEEPAPPEEPTQAPAETSRPDSPGSVNSSGTAQLSQQTAMDVTVTYDPNGGDTPIMRTTVSSGGVYGLQPEATRRGYAFGGWWTDPNGGAQVFPDTAVTQTDAHTLYAHWQEKRTCTVTFDGAGGRVKSRESTLELSDGDRYGPLPTPLREGYDFDGWFTAPDGGEQITEESVFTGNSDVTLYAHWIYDPYEFWSFTLRNKTQQVYLCQEVSIYFELEQNGQTRQNAPLISATGSTNIAANRTDPAVTDDWVREKNPQVVVKVVSSMSGASAAKSAAAARFPNQEIIIVSASALNGGADALYAQLALAKHLYGDWFTDVDLSVVAAELGVSEIPVLF